MNKYTSLHDEILGIEPRQNWATHQKIQIYGDWEDTNKSTAFTPKPYKENKVAETVVGIVLAIGFVVLLYLILIGK